MVWLSSLVAVLAITVVAIAVSGKYRRFDAVGHPNTDFLSHSGQNLDEIAMIPTDESVSEEAIFHSEAFDAADDLLDPHNAGHAKWVAEHESSILPDARQP